MDFNQFKDECASYIEEALDNTVIVKQIQTLKNNGRKLSGLNIVAKDQCITPTIYLDDLYLEYLNGKTISTICEAIIKQYYNASETVCPNLDFFDDKDEIKKRILLKVVNYEKNSELLEEIPYVGFLDLAAIFYFQVYIEGIGEGDIVIRKEHIRRWKLPLEELYKAALDNTRRAKGVEIMNMDDILLEMLLAKTTQDEFEKIKELIIAERNMEGFFPMYVLSNKERIFGATTILFDEALMELRDRFEDDYYVIPSSIHEVIVIPKGKTPETFDIKEMVESTNAIHVTPGEILSDSVYLFDSSKGELLLVNN